MKHFSPDLAFKNLSDLWDNGIFVRTFSDENREFAFALTTNLLKAISGKNLDGLETALKYLHWDLRGYIPNPNNPESRWTNRRIALHNEIGINTHALNAEIVETGKSLISRLNLLTAQDSNYGQEIVEIVKAEPEVAFVVERPWQRSELEALLVGLFPEPEYQIFHLGRFVSFPPANFKKVVILAAPRKLSDNHIRAIVLGGISGNYSFLAPNWLIGNEPTKIGQQLVPTLRTLSLPTVHLIGPKSDDLSIQTEDFFVEDLVVESPLSIEKLISHGDVYCRHIHLNDGLIIPVESDATRISTLLRDEESLIRVSFKKPFDELTVGEVVFNLRDGAEDTFLMDLAAMSMGTEFRTFTSARLKWKSRAKTLIDEFGFDSTVNSLKSKGVSTAHYLQDWIDDDDFVSPRAKSDWSNFLKALGFSSVEVSNLTSLTTKLRAQLISIGQQARSAMADSINSEEWDRIQAGQVVTKKLAEYGDAEFIISTVTTIGDVILKCHPNDLRKVRRL